MLNFTGVQKILDSLRGSSIQKSKLMPFHQVAYFTLECNVSAFEEKKKKKAMERRSNGIWIMSLAFCLFVLDELWKFLEIVAFMKVVIPI